MRLARETEYPVDAFLFVQRGLDFTVRKAHGEAPVDVDAVEFSRHVDGTMLCHGLRDYAVQEYGLLARAVLRHWHINDCLDFGRIVFAMVDAGLMHKTDDDSMEDFVGVFSFRDAFGSALVLAESN